MIAALFVEERGPYSELREIDLWDVKRDARNYDGPYPVIAHPPCERWGRYWSGGPSAKVRKHLGDDRGCFWSALMAVRKYGGVLEHPEASKAWSVFGIPRPKRQGGWLQISKREWTCCVEQGHYGHPARKATWLYFVGEKPIDLIWGPARGKRRLDEGFRSKDERIRARASGQPPISRLSIDEKIHTPPQFRDLLIELVKESHK